MKKQRATIGIWSLFLMIIFILIGPASAGTVQNYVSGNKAGTAFTLTPQGLAPIPSLSTTNGKAIVKFKALPLVKFKNAALSARSSSLSAVQSVQARFKSDVLALENNAQKNKGLRSLALNQVVKKTYKNVFNGAAVEVSRETLEKIKQLAYVEAVYPDQEVKAVLNESVPLIGADKVWNEFGLTGQGVKVAIVDTGIDYKHADFGAYTSFPNPKIVGGYDCINNDNDPMDDYGHGTHVAGIVAANGALKGVAPQASLMAFKVLNASGS
ncbi:MAG: hypothetical protein EHM45_18390, partial [Desulfobacteraceae bacterium]